MGGNFFSAGGTHTTVIKLHRHQLHIYSVTNANHLPPYTDVIFAKKKTSGVEVGEFESPFSLSFTPNPSKSSIDIEYNVPGRIGDRILCDISLKVYSKNGGLVRTLVDGREPPGRYRILWNGLDNRDNIVKSGEYFLHFKADGKEAKKLIIV